MIRLIIIFSILLTNQTFGQSTISAAISLPQNSGLAFVDFEMYKVQDDTLYVINRSFGIFLLDSSDTLEKRDPYHYDTLATYPIGKEHKQELIDILTQTDSLGHHSAMGCIFTMGWPRFLIYANYNDKKMEGYVANCYREHIYRIVDIFNKIYPEGNVLTYDKNELLTLETDCNKKWEQDLKEYDKE